MVFASPIFLFLFLPLVLIAYFAMGRRVRNFVLLVFSLLFYAWGEAQYLLLVLASILFNWTIGLVIARKASIGGRRAWLAVGICGDLAVLAYMKYANFAVENANTVLHWFGGAGLTIPGVVLPLGVSFFTFHAISYLIDIHRRSADAERNLMNYSLYILLFPQLIAGPIIRWKHIYQQLRDRQETLADFRWGINRFVLGLGKKMLVANPLGVVADKVFAIPPDQLPPGTAWLGLVCYTLQIYFDFSGYSDMAIGLMRMFGFHILENFDYPYIARSIREFWRRWHISLSTWFRDYVYIPLGGNQASLPRACLNVMIVFLLSGLWHGANWTFVLWGAWHGLCICVEIVWLAKILDRAGRLSHLYGLAAIVAGWVLFRSPSLEHAIGYYAALFGYHRLPGVDAGAAAATLVDREVMVALAIGIVGSMPVGKVLGAGVGRARSAGGALGMAANLGHVVALIGIFTLAAGALAAGSYNPFIYFRF